MPNFAPLPIAALRKAEATLCRVRRRGAYWQGCGDQKCAVGKLLKECLTFRSREYPAHRMTQIDFASAATCLCGQTIGDTVAGNFLNGTRSGKTPWETLADSLLRFILLGGTLDETANFINIGSQFGSQDDEAESIIVADRIIDYFFPIDIKDDPRALATEFRFMTHAATAREALAELRGFTYECSHSSNMTGLVVRTSGKRRFFQVDANGNPTVSFDPTMDGIRAGSYAVYIYTCSEGENLNGAAQSAEAVEQIATEQLSAEELKRLLLVRLEPDQKAVSPESKRHRVAAEWCHPIWRYVLHLPLPYQTNGRIEPRLMLSRSSRFAPNAFAPDQYEIQDFVDWVRAFLSAELNELW